MIREMKIKQAKQRSHIEEQQLIVEDPDTREYFRFLEGRLTEYQLTKDNGKIIKLQKEEQEGDSIFEYQIL
jgi:hypothetical protein